MYNAGQVRLVSVGRFKEGELRVSDFGKRLRGTGESFLADVDIAVAHGGAFMAGGAPYLGKVPFPQELPHYWRLQNSFGPAIVPFSAVPKIS
jgi:hypothetical protein